MQSSKKIYAWAQMQVPLCVMGFVSQGMAECRVPFSGQCDLDSDL